MQSEIEDCLDLMEVLVDIEISPFMPPDTIADVLIFAANAQPDLFGM